MCVCVFCSLCARPRAPSSRGKLQIADAIIASTSPFAITAISPRGDYRGDFLPVICMYGMYSLGYVGYNHVAHATLQRAWIDCTREYA